MEDDEKRKPPLCFDDDLDHDITHFESLSEPDLDAYLTAHDIATDETVKAVQKIVKDKLDEWRDRGLLHGETLVVPGSSATAMRRASGRRDRRFLHASPIAVPGITVTVGCSTRRASPRSRLEMRGDEATVIATRSLYAAL
ncbi:MAG: hypothetical protein QOE68_3388 [Thermoanaerobaculia bacterium]|nr:hypothetical protein [Thermoanaerobaculia bacterium]